MLSPFTVMFPAQNATVLSVVTVHVALPVLSDRANECLPVTYERCPIAPERYPCTVFCEPPTIDVNRELALFWYPPATPAKLAPAWTGGSNEPKKAIKRRTDRRCGVSGHTLCKHDEIDHGVHGRSGRRTHARTHARTHLVAATTERRRPRTTGVVSDATHNGGVAGTKGFAAEPAKAHTVITERLIVLATTNHSRLADQTPGAGVEVHGVVQTAEDGAGDGDDLQPDRGAYNETAQQTGSNAHGVNQASPFVVARGRPTDRPTTTRHQARAK